MAHPAEVERQHVFFGRNSSCQCFILRQRCQILAADDMSQRDIAPSLQFSDVAQAGIEPEIELRKVLAERGNDGMMTACALNGIEIGNVECFERV